MSNFCRKRTFQAKPKQTQKGGKEDTYVGTCFEIDTTKSSGYTHKYVPYFLYDLNFCKSRQYCIWHNSDNVPSYIRSKLGTVNYLNSLFHPPIMAASGGGGNNNHPLPRFIFLRLLLLGSFLPTTQYYGAQNSATIILPQNRDGTLSRNMTLRHNLQTH